MPRIRSHVGDLPTGGATPPSALTKQEFGRRVYRLMMQKGWNQSELARQSGLPRDAISTYVRGQSFPTPKNLQKLAEALDSTPADLLPNYLESAIDEDFPSFEMKTSPSAPGTSWLRVNRLVEFKTAMAIAQLLMQDKYSPGGEPANGHDHSDDSADAV